MPGLSMDLGETRPNPSGGSSSEEDSDDDLGLIKVMYPLPNLLSRGRCREPVMHL